MIECDNGDTTIIGEDMILPKRKERSTGYFTTNDDPAFRAFGW